MRRGLPNKRIWEKFVSLASSLHNCKKVAFFSRKRDITVLDTVLNDPLLKDTATYPHQPNVSPRFVCGSLIQISYRIYVSDPARERAPQLQ